MIYLPHDFMSDQFPQFKFKRKFKALTLAFSAAALISGCALHDERAENKAAPTILKGGAVLPPDPVVKMRKANIVPLNCRERVHKWKNGVCHLNDGSPKEPTEWLNFSWGPIGPKPPYMPPEPKPEPKPETCKGHDCEGHDPFKHDAKIERLKHHPASCRSATGC